MDHKSSSLVLLHFARDKIMTLEPILPDDYANAIDNDDKTLDCYCKDMKVVVEVLVLIVKYLLMLVSLPQQTKKMPTVQTRKKNAEWVSVALVQLLQSFWLLWLLWSLPSLLLCVGVVLSLSFYFH